jgi:hypothetical protein
VDTVRSVEAPQGFEALVAGPSTLENDFIQLAEEGLQQGESVGLAVALVVLVFVFGAVVAGLITRGRERQWRPARLDAAPLREVAEWTERYRRFWEESYDRLDEYLEELRGRGKEKGDGRKR